MPLGYEIVEPRTVRGPDGRDLVVNCAFGRPSGKLVWPDGSTSAEHDRAQDDSGLWEMPDIACGDKSCG